MIRKLKLEKIFRNLSTFKLIISFIFFLICLKIVEQIFGNIYDWDIDHRIYYSSRLLEGELNFVKEFDDQLPIMQYLFLIPAYLKSNKIWTLFSIILSIFTSRSIYNFLLRIFKLDWKISEKINIKKIAFTSALIYLLLISSLVGSFSHINAVATSFSILSITTYFQNLEKESKSTKIKEKIFPAFLASFAISMRPYFLPSIILSVFWYNFRSRNFFEKVFFRRNLLFLLKDLFIYTILITIFGFLINCSPYILSGNFKSLINGIYLNSLPLHPTDTFGILLNQLKQIVIQGNIQSLIYLGFLFPIFTLCTEVFKIRNYQIKYNLPKIDLIFIGVLSPLLVELVILNKHYWAHYIQFFSGYSAIAIGFSYAIIKSSPQNNLGFETIKINKIFFNAFLITLLIFIGRLELTSSGFQLLKNTNSLHSKNKELVQVRNFIELRKNNNEKIDFLFPSSMYVHWNLRESRKGFPNAANFGYIDSGYWENIKLRLFDEEDYSKDGICKMMIQYGPSIFFTYDDSPEYKCFEQNSTSLNKKILISENNNKRSLYAFLR